MSLMSKLLTIWIGSALLLFGGTLTTKQKIEKFLKTSIKANPNIKVLGFKVAKVVDLKDKIPGWKAYILTIDIELLKQNNRVITIKDALFSNGKYISRAFVDINTKKKLKDELLKKFSPDAPMSYYDDEHLLYGSKDAKYKLLAFSDPQCPFCIDFMPDLMKFVKKHPKDFALYYYHMPLSIHPGSDTIVKAEIYLEQKGDKDISLKGYEKQLDIEKKDPKVVLEKFNKALKTNVTLQNIRDKKVEKRLSEDLYRANKILVNGTPTIYLNGKMDYGREKVQKLMDEYNTK